MPHRILQTVLALALGINLVTPATITAADTTSPATELTLKVGQSRVKSFGESPTILVPTVFVKLPVAGKVFAVKQGGGLSMLGGGKANTVKASAHYTVTGLDKKLAQELAGKAHDDFVEQLRAAGFTVKTYADLKDLPSVQNAKREANDKTWNMPSEKDASGNTVFVIATPSDEQSFKSGMSGGIFNQFMRMGKSTLGEGTIIIPTYTIAAPQAWGETGGGYKSISAEVNVAPGMNLTHAIASVLTEKGGWGDVHTKEQVINISEKVGELTKTDATDKAGNAFSSALSSLTGSGKISSSKGNYELTIDPAAYQAGLLRGVTAFNAEVAKTAAEARK